MTEEQPVQVLTCICGNKFPDFRGGEFKGEYHGWNKHFNLCPTCSTIFVEFVYEWMKELGKSPVESLNPNQKRLVETEESDQQ